MWLNNAKCFDVSTYIRCLLTLFIIVILAKVSAGYGLVALTLLAIAALSTNRPEKLYFVVLMCVTMIVTSSSLVPKSALSLLFIRLTLMGISFLLTMRIVGLRSSRYLSPALWLMPYIIMIALTSIAGWSPIISELKIVLFTTIFFSFYSSGSLLLHDERVGEQQLRAMMLAVASYYILGSILLIPIPAVSVMNIEVLRLQPGLKSLFCGITNHSQCLGPVCAIWGVIVLGDMLMGVRKVSRLHLLLLIFVPYLIWRTQSRTAMGAWIAGMLVVLYYFLKDRTTTARWKQNVMSLAFMAGISACIAVLAVPHFRQAAVSFINKRGRSDAKQVDTAGILSSRVDIAQKSLYYFKKSPMVGNGFQVSETMARFKAKSFKDLIAAPIEKGFIWTAVLEEGGLVGFALFLIFLFGFTLQLLKRKAYIGLSTFTVLIVANMGEFNFFSLSYSGGIMWASVFLGIVLDGFRLREGLRRQAAMMMQQSLFGPMVGPQLNLPAYR